ncbi:MAG TPA: hypothetical protein VGN07_08005 [Steroidobacteraceae bacterium]|jgi:hypothetical protein
MNAAARLRIVVITFSGLAVLGLACTAHAECAFPRAPASIPDGKTATEQEMLAATTAFKTYNEEVNAFGGCLDQETRSRSVGTAQLMQFKTIQSKKLTAAVDELKEQARRLNEQVRAFKSR